MEETQVQVQPLALTLSIPAVDTILKALGKMSIEEAGSLYAHIAQQRQEHVQSAIDAAKKEE